MELDGAPMDQKTDVTSTVENTASGSVQVHEIADADGRRRFIEVAKIVGKDDPNFVAPLDLDIGDRLDPEKNPGLKGAEHQLWIAEKNGAPVGRISAYINPRHLKAHNDNAGHFGFIDAIDDPEVFDALFKAAEDWMRSRGLSKIAGPFSFSVNEEVGLLVDGFDTPPYVMMPHAQRWYKNHIERLGFTKAMDMFALNYVNERQFIPEKRKRFVERALSNPKVNIRLVDFKKFNEEVRTAVAIFNDAWSENWSFVPFSDEQAAHMASELRPIIEKHNFVICEFDGEPAAFGLVLPNINEVIKPFDGKLLPFNWLTLLYRLKIKGLSQARMPLMGVRKDLQGKPVGAAFAYKIIDLVNSANIERGLKSSELGWILENNKPMLNMLTEMGGEIYKTYRVYEKAL